MSLNKAQMIERVRHLRNLDTHTANKAVNVVLDEISNALSEGNRVEIRGFGVFAPTHRKPRIGRNPRTGEKVDVDGKVALAFRASRHILNRLNDAND
jgi:integration host factor subunit beta